jgi:GTP-binding protein
MYYVDEAKITIQAGTGGHGKVSFYPRKKGPNGGNGGKGGDIYIKLNNSLSSLDKYTSQKEFQAEDGGHGEANRKKGKAGNDLVLEFPPNTTLVDTETGETFLIDEDNPKHLICKGGKGGLGNNAFKSSTNRTPRKATPGKSGEIKNLKIVHHLLADIGFIGLPNAGKSSLLNVLTAAGAKIGGYPFTTLEPNLGAMNKVILADIPGLIEGASQGKGLGTKFLKHVSKVRLIVHCISSESKDLQKDYKIVIDELASYDKNLLDKQFLLLLTKKDLISEEQIEGKLKVLKQITPNVRPISIYDEKSIKNLKYILNTY